MKFNNDLKKPEILKTILKDAERRNFTMSCDNETGNLLRTLVASKKKGNLLELGTGAGVSTCWILEGMDEESTLTSVELDEDVQSIARKNIKDNRVEFITMDGNQYIEENKNKKRYDLIFADTWPGKYQLLEETLGMVAAGGMYIIDDLTPVELWPKEHEEKAKNLIQYIELLENFHVTGLQWSTGIVIATRIF